MAAIEQHGWIGQLREDYSRSGLAQSSAPHPAPSPAERTSDAFIAGIKERLRVENGGAAKLPSHIQARIDEIRAQAIAAQRQAREKAEQRRAAAPGLVVRIAEMGIQSSTLMTIGYCPESRVLKLRYRTGMVYLYFEVPPAIYDGLLSASSAGRYLNAEIKPNFDYVRVAA